MPDGGPTVSGIEVEDPVVAFERPEETDFEFAIVAAGDDPCCAFDPDGTAASLASVDHTDAAIGPRGIFGLCLGAAALEPIREGFNFVPRARVAREIDGRSGLRRGKRGAGGEQSGRSKVTGKATCHRPRLAVQRVGFEQKRAAQQGGRLRRQRR